MDITIVKKQNKIYVNNKEQNSTLSFCYKIGNIYNLDDLYKFKEEMTVEDRLLKLYELYHENLFFKLNGEYALIFIIQGKIILVRDRLGSKNLYYYQNKELFICTNNLANIIQQFSKNLTIDKQQLCNFLIYNYIMPPYTIFKNVYKLRAGYYVTYQKRIHTTAYYDLEEEFLQNKNKIKENSDAFNAIECNLLNSIKRRIREQKKIGVFFSSGVDSTLVTSLLKKLNVENINTYTIGFFDEERNEASSAKQIAQFLNTCHHEYYLEESQVLDIVHKIPVFYADLISDPSVIPMLYLNDKVKDEKMDVILTGDGADQLFCGSNIYDSFSIPTKLKLILKYFYYLVFKQEKFTYHEIKDNYRLCVGRDKITKKILNQKPQSYNILHIKYFHEQVKFMLNDIQTFLSNRLFLKLNISSTHYNLNSVHPFIDNDFIKTAFQLKHKFRYYHRKRKYILKKILAQNIPEVIQNNSKKGFGIPLGKWIYTLFKEEIIEYSQEKNLKKQNLFIISNINELISKLQHNNLTIEETQVLFSYYIFQLWYYKYIDKLD